MDNPTPPTTDEIAPPPATRRLEYDDSKSNHATRRQMNFLLLLALVNTLMFAAFVCLPGVSPHLKKFWDDYQKSREDQRLAAARQVKLNACLTHTFPGDKVVYTDEPNLAAKLLAGDASGQTLPSTPHTQNFTIETQFAAALAASPWRPPAVTGPSPTFAAYWSAVPAAPNIGAAGNAAALFLHELRTPTGRRRLVLIGLTAEQFMNERTKSPRRLQEHEYEIATTRTFHAVVINPDDPRAAPVKTYMVLADPPAARATVSAVFDDQNRNPVVTVRPAPRWRVYAAQFDPADPAHVTIAYQVDGRGGVIDGRLNDADRVMLQPRTGQLQGWSNGNGYVWDLPAAVPPATQPAR